MRKRTDRRRFARSVVLFVLAMFLTSVLTLPERAVQAAGVVTDPTPFEVAARSALLVDAHTGQVLYSFNPDEPFQPASLAKIVVFDLTLEALERGEIQLDDRARVSEKAWRLSLDSGVSRMFLEVGNEVAIRDLLFGLMVSSGNDAAVVLAEHLAGDEELFVRKMNEHVQAFGMTQTHFINSHGLEAEGQQTTVSDMAILARHVVNAHPEGVEYSQAKEFLFTIALPQPNFNRLVFRDERITGLKTGHLSVAGYHLVATAVDGPMSMISIVAGADSEAAREDEAYKLLNYGFNEFETVTLDGSSVLPSHLPVYKGRDLDVAISLADDITLTIPRGRFADLKLVADFNPSPLQAPIQFGESVGSLQAELDGRMLMEQAVITQEEVQRGNLWKVFVDSLKLWFGQLF